MGGCSSDYYKTIKKQHGQLFQKYIVGSESLLQFKQLIEDKINVYNIQSEQKRQAIHDEIKKRQELMLSHYQMTVNDMKEKLPLSIEDYEQMKKQKVSQILGLEEYQRRFDGVHSQVDRQINERKQATNKEYEQILTQVENESKMDSEKMVQYHEMPQERRVMIRQKAVKEFGELISKRLKDLQSKYSDHLDTQRQINSLQSVISFEQVDHLVNMGKNKFLTQTITLMGGFMDSEINV